MRRAEPERPHAALLPALAALGGVAAVPMIAETLSVAVGRESWETARAALAALRVFGPAAAPALATIRSAVVVDDTWTRSAAVAALWAVGADPDEVVPPALALLETSGCGEAADVLGRIGPAAVAALPRLRALASGGSPWNRASGAAAVWAIAGEPAARFVLDALLRAWRENSATAGVVVACLRRMGPAAAPALPQIRTELATVKRDGYFTRVESDDAMLRDLTAMLRAMNAARLSPVW